jgi:inosose dehydratase
VKEKAIMKQIRGRREFLQMAAAGVVAAGTTTALAGRSALEAEGQGSKAKAEVLSAPPVGRQPGFELGMASYTLREFDLDQALQMTKRVGLTHICFKDMHLPLDCSPEKIAEVVAKVKDAGLDLYAGGVVYMRNEQQVNQAFDYAKAAGMRIIVGVPNRELLPLVNRKVQKYDIKVAIHNHGPTDKVYPIPATAYELIKDLDKRIGLCNDIGHTTRAGVDVPTCLEAHADRLLDVHMKDVSAATAHGGTVEIGRGVIDIPRVLQTLIKIDYTGIVSFEHEKDGNDPLPGVAESIGYVRGVLRTLSS